ncbi:DUF2312 domain-containing protein [Pararhizobium antarcticum]|uniref:DUF2312 domain-containing protein n=1 Tax=Pararhizobium antarcticum TaxID=1798805 RepID=UPI0008FF85C7|nr:DUF2312 domain-containing protein [Pararhizobium antarcticum]
MTEALPVARDQLKAIVQRVERLEAEIADLNADKSEIYKEARANGFDVKAIKKVVQKRKLDDAEREEQDIVFDTYWDAIHGTNLVHAPAREIIEEFDPITGEFVDRDARRRARSSEAMDDTKALSAEALALGLISEEGHASTVAMADAVARKFGNGPLDTPSDATPPASVTAAVVSSSHDAATGEAEGYASSLPDNQPETADETVGGFPVAAAPTNAEETGDNVHVKDVTGGESAEMDRSTKSSFAARSGEAEKVREAIPARSEGAPLTHAEAGESPAPIPKPSPDEMRITNALVLRPNCKRPGQETCGGAGRQHCRDCASAPAEREKEDA